MFITGASRGFGRIWAEAALLRGDKVAAVAGGDNEGFLSPCADDAGWTLAGARTLRGKEAVRRWVATADAEPPKFTASFCDL